MAQGGTFVTLENRGLFFALKQSVTFDLPYISVQCILELFAIKTLLHDIFLYRDCLKGCSSFIPLNILKNMLYDQHLFDLKTLHNLQEELFMYFPLVYFLLIYGKYLL